jgi:hypothetical protein
VRLRRQAEPPASGSASGSAPGIDPISPISAWVSSLLASKSDAATVDADGRFLAQPLAPGRYALTVEDRQGRAIAWAPGRVPEGAAGPEQPLVLDRSEPDAEALELDLRVVARDAEIGGVVVEGEGDRELPVSDAWVRAYLALPDGQADGRSWPGVDEPLVLTDENGLFVLDQLRPDRRYVVVAEGRRGRGRVTQRDVPSGSRVTLALAPVSTIQGVVQTPEGSPASAYELELIGPSHRRQRIRSDDGRFEVDHLEPGTYRVWVRSDGEGAGEARVELGEGARETVEITLVRPKP